MSDVTDAAARRDDARLRAALEAAAGWYRVRLLALRPAAVVGLLRDRGLVDLAVATPAGLRWRVGHAPGGLSRTALVEHLRRCGFAAEEMVAAGLATPAHQGTRSGADRGRWGNGVVDALRHRLVVPLVDAGGVVGFTARRLSDDNPSVPKWVNTATTALYRKGEHLLGVAQQGDQLTAGRGQVVLVEGAVDAIAVNLAGHIGLAAGGTQLTAAHAAQLRDAAAATGGPLLVAYDGDQPGREATLRAADLLGGGLDAPAVRLPEGRDPADVLVAAGARGLRRALGVSVPLVDAAVTARSDRWAAHAGNPVALVDAVRDVAALVTAAPPDGRARLVGLVAGRLGLLADLVTATLLDAAASS